MDMKFVAEQQLVVSYPRMDTAQSRPRVPSFYALEVVRAALSDIGVAGLTADQAGERCGLTPFSARPRVTELVLADLDSVTKRIDKTQKKAKSGDKEAIIEVALLQKLEPHLNSGKTANTLVATPEEAAHAANWLQHQANEMINRATAIRIAYQKFHGEQKA